MKKINQVREELIAIGDETKATYDQTKDLGAAKVAVQAYTGAIKTAVAQIHYKKLTGNPGVIPFLEEE